MSGDVQPRKRKDKKRKKDELGVEEPRGTAAALGEGDVFIHSYHDHGTGGHWCAKIIFFSLLAVLVTLIGLIILENRGLTELEANSVESRYSGVLEGWLEDAPDDGHHDEHTLELNHPDDDEDDHEHDKDGHDDDNELDHDQEDEHDDEDENDDSHDGEQDELNQSEEDDDDDEEINEKEDVADSQEENDEDEQEEVSHRKYYYDEETENDGDENDDDELQEVDESEEANEQSQAVGSNEDDENDSTDNDVNEENETKDESEEATYREEENTADNEDEEEHDDEDEEDAEVEIERIEKEIDLDPISNELPALPEEDDDDDNDKSEELSTELEARDTEDDDDGVAPEDLDDDFLEDDSDEPPIERITAPVGKPLVEVEEEDSSVTPPDTLAEEEEYEKQQEEKKREEEKSSHMWLKLSVGGALLVATHAVVRRATAPREAPAEEERSEREETPLIDRRMTLIPEEPIPVPRISSTSYAPSVPKETSPPEEEEYEEDDEEKQIEDEEIEVVPSAQDTEEKELYSDEEVEEEDKIVVKQEVPKLSAPKPEEKVAEPEPEAEDDPDDVEIIDEEQLEEEFEEDDEEEISDVDDAELLSRLEAKYGRLPEPERPGQKPKDGGNSMEDEWPGEPSDAFWRQELDSAEEDLRQGSWSAAAARASAPELQGSGRARWLRARAADLLAEAKRDNYQLGLAIAGYLELLKMNEKLSDDRLRQVAARAIDRIMFRGKYLSAEPVYRLLIRRFPDEVAHRNNLTISFLMANRADLAEEVLKETLQKWPNDRVALAHYGFVLKTLKNRLEEAVEAFQKALEGDTGTANEPRFYYHLGDALLLLGKPAEAHEVHKRGAKLGHFLSPAQRSLYNVPRLKSRPWWNIEETPYAKLVRSLEKNWKEILKEGEAAKALYEKEKEGLKERGDWSQLDLFARGQEIPNRCKNAPVTCSVVRSEPAAVGCRRGQIKFSAMVPGTHVRPHVGPTNCRLRMHLGLSNTRDTFIRVDQTVRQWQVGKVFMFDDSFEHEVWHNGTGTRLVLIVDVWHPDLTPHERRSLPAI